MDCGACMAIPKLNMLWLDAFGTPKNLGGYRSFQGLEGNSYEMRIINLYLPEDAH